MRAVTLAIALLGAGPAPAAPGDNQLETYVVTGTRTEKTVEDAPVRTEVVTAEEIERTHARNLKEALEDIPGLQLSKIHGKAGYEASLQGLSGEQVLVLVDGLPITATTGSTVDLTQLAVADIERIEVVKGAMSAQYGSSAMGGVINVITKGIRSGLHGEITLDAGSYGDQNPSGDDKDLSNQHAQFSLGGGNDKLRLRLIGDIRESDGIDPDPASWPIPGEATDRSQFNLRSEWHIAPGRSVWGEASQFNEETHSRYLVQRPGNRVEQANDETAERRRFSGGGHWMFGNGVRIQVSALDEQMENDSIKSGSGIFFDDRRAEFGLTRINAVVDLPNWGAHILQFGADYHAESLGQSKDGVSELDVAGRVTRNSKEVFAQDDILLSEVWELVLGLRYQEDSDFGSHSAPKINLRGHLVERETWSGTLRLGWGEGYRVPNLKERYFLFDHSALGYVVIGNPNLQPETSKSWQLGWRSQWRAGHWLDINLFDNRLKNLIQVDQDNAQVNQQGNLEFIYTNLSRASTRGVEIGGFWNLSPILGLTAGYTYLSTKDENSGQELTRRPEHQVRLGFDWQLNPRLALSTRARYQSRELINSNGDYSPSWAVVDTSLNFDWSEQLRLFVGVDNLFHEQRDFTVGGTDFRPIEGRFAYLGLRYAWQSH
ncbi:MAG: TonB-dependent receptor plug domain-containing protein [Nevskiales bacterium]